jgi:hypothetical protein
MGYHTVKDVCIDHHRVDVITIELYPEKQGFFSKFGQNSLCFGADDDVKVLYCLIRQLQKSNTSATASNNIVFCFPFTIIAGKRQTVLQTKW